MMVNNKKLIIKKKLLFIYFKIICINGCICLVIMFGNIIVMRVLNIYSVSVVFLRGEVECFKVKFIYLVWLVYC